MSIVALVLTGLGQPALAQDAGEAYPIMPGDRVLVRVGAWDIVDETYRDWTGLSGEYAVMPGGEILLPVAGAIDTRGRSLSELSDHVALALKSAIGLSTPPSASIEVAAYRPVIVAGDVAAPGEYEMRAGLTVRQAVALAGGPRRLPEEDATRLLGQKRRLEEALLRGSLRVARLESELAGETHFEIPQGAGSASEFDRLVQIEQQLLERRSSSLAAQAQSVNELIEFYREIRGEFSAQLEVVRSELSRAAEEVARRDELFERGLARSSDQASAQSAYSQLQLREIDLSVQILHMEEKLSAARHDLEELQARRELSVLEELAAARDRQRDLELDLASVDAVIAGAAPPSAAPRMITRSYHLIRAGRPELVPADEETLLEPGDTVVLSTAETPA